MRDAKLAFAAAALWLLIAFGGASSLTGCRARRSLTLSDFGFLERGMSLEEITDRVGEPDREVGSGLGIYVYDLADGRKVRLVFVHLSSCLDGEVIEKDGTLRNILEALDEISED